MASGDRERRGGGNFRERKTGSAKDITLSDWTNPWSFFHLFTRPTEDVIEWMRDQGLLAREIKYYVYVGFQWNGRSK